MAALWPPLFREMADDAKSLLEICETFRADTAIVNIMFM